MEAGLTLREVEDIVFSNTRTLEFFNSADLEQVCWRDGWYCARRCVEQSFRNEMPRDTYTVI